MRTKPGLTLAVVTPVPAKRRPSGGTLFRQFRRPEQKEERRQHLLDTAKTALHGGMAVSEPGLNELARQAQMTKSNVYRYFENREELLLALLEEESDQWRADLGARLAAAPQLTLEQISRDFASSCASRPLMCRLFSILPFSCGRQSR